MTKGHDIVETSLMSMEYNGSLIDVEKTAKTDLDNGRLVVRDGNTYKYPTDSTATELFLVTTPEKTYENVGLTEFYNKKDRKVRVVRVPVGDKFGTTAFVGTVAVGDVLMVDNQGQLVAKAATPAVEFTVRSKRIIGGFEGVIVERTK